MLAKLFKPSVPLAGRTPQIHKLETCNVLCLKALRAFCNFKLYCLTLVQGLVTIHLNCGEMHENILSGLPLDESVTLRSVKPLHRSLFLHCHYLARVGIALPLSVRYLVTANGQFPLAAQRPCLPSAAIPSARKKRPQVVTLQPLLNRSKGNTRATNASRIVPRKQAFVHARARAFLVSVEPVRICK